MLSDMYHWGLSDDIRLVTLFGLSKQDTNQKQHSTHETRDPAATQRCSTRPKRGHFVSQKQPSKPIQADLYKSY